MLTPEEMEIAAAWYDIGDLGDMHHDPARNVLHVKQTLDAVGARAGKTHAEARVLVEAAHAKLYAARCERPVPFIDKTVYTSWNALAVSAYLQAAQVLRLPEARAFALLTLDRLLREGLHAEKGLAHVIAYATGGRAGLRGCWRTMRFWCTRAWMRGWRLARIRITARRWMLRSA